MAAALGAELAERSRRRDYSVREEDKILADERLGVMSCWRKKKKTRQSQMPRALCRTA